MDSDEEDFVFYGTPIEREEDITSRRKKAQAEASGNLRSLAPWKQEVTDEEGRRRFHGAFTGGFSAGYYNTVGSKEGWTPQSFTSSRKSRAEARQQNILNFLDEDEKEELQGKLLGTSSQFDTFGFTAAEVARKQVEKEKQQRPSAIPGPVPDELVVPAAESIGVKLLLKMGWRRGRSIKDSHADALYDARREARKALLAFSSGDTKAGHTESESIDSCHESSVEQPFTDDRSSSQSTPVYVLNPKQDLHGLGYDPYKHAPEFREKKKSRTSGGREPGYRKPLSIKDSLFGFKSGRVAPGFGIGALEDYDVEDEDVYGSGYDFEDNSYVQEDEEPSRSTADNRPRLMGRKDDCLPGFVVASKSEYQLERFDPPVVPKDFVPHHEFPGPFETPSKSSVPQPPEVPPPENNNLKTLIEGVATLVARCGKLFEDLSREKNQSNPLFSFLTGGSGHDYYARKLWEQQQKRSPQTKLSLDGKVSRAEQKMTVDSRGKLLGERPLERTPGEENSSAAAENVVQIQFNLSDTFTKSASSGELPEVMKPFKDDPAKQERFERFLKEKYQGGLRSTGSGGTSNMSEAARARERLDFEAAAEAIEKGKCSKENVLSHLQSIGFSTAGTMQFTSGGLEQVKDAQAEDLTKKAYPKREEFQWRPSPILCKRFDLIDPYMGKPPPAPRMKSKMDSLIFMPDTVKPTKLEQSIAGMKDQLTACQSDAEETKKDDAQKDTEVEAEVENVERPVDLYKAIFSDDSDDDEQTIDLRKAEDPRKTMEVTTTALSHFIAGDFLESLGKELGLEVPPENPYSTSKTINPALKQTTNSSIGVANTLSMENKSSSTRNAPSRISIDQGPPHSQEDKTLNNESMEKVTRERMPEKVEARSPSRRHHRHHRQNSLSSSEDERSKKRSRRHKYSSESYSDSSSDDRDRYHSRSKGRKKRSSRDKSSSSSIKRKHHKHRSRDSPSRSHYSAEREHGYNKKEKKKRRD